MQRYGQESEFKDRLVAVNLVSKTVKGGRNMRFTALVIEDVSPPLPLVAVSYCWCMAYR